MNKPSEHNGVLLINKPTGLTSHDVVDKVRQLIGQKAVGHTGTLDPLAEGLLILCLGKATKVARFIAGQSKTYKARITLGLCSKTFDAEGIDPTTEKPVPPIDTSELEVLLAGFVGTSKQRVPVHSAIRVDGKRLYERARNGEDIIAPEREIEIQSLSLDQFVSPDITITTRVSSGTYIRSLAHDIGQRLDCGGYLAHLQRTEIGKLVLDQAIGLDELKELTEKGEVSSRVLPIEAVLDFGAMKVTDQFSSVVRQGRTVRESDITGLEGTFDLGDHVLLKDGHGRVLAVGTARRSSSEIADGKDGELFGYERVLV